MGKAVVTLKIMPTSPDTDLKELETKALAEIESFCSSKETKVEIEPIAFGLKAVKIIFVMDEMQGSPDPVAEKVAQMPNVNSAEIIDVRRAIG